MNSQIPEILKKLKYVESEESKQEWDLKESYNKEKS